MSRPERLAEGGFAETTSRDNGILTLDVYGEALDQQIASASSKMTLGKMQKERGPSPTHHDSPARENVKSMKQHVRKTGAGAWCVRGRGVAMKHARNGVGKSDE